MQRVAFFLILSILVGGAASAQQPEKPAAKSPEEIREIKASRLA